MTKVTIGNTKIGFSEPTFIIAEAGLNHDGKFIQAKELVKMAAKTGADEVGLAHEIEAQASHRAVWLQRVA